MDTSGGEQLKVESVEGVLTGTSSFDLTMSAKSVALHQGSVVMRDATVCLRSRVALYSLFGTTVLVLGGSDQLRRKMGVSCVAALSFARKLLQAGHSGVVLAWLVDACTQMSLKVLRLTSS